MHPYMPPPSVMHAIACTHKLHVNPNRPSQRDRACAFLVLVCPRLGLFFWSRWCVCVCFFFVSIIGDTRRLDVRRRCERADANENRMPAHSGVLLPPRSQTTGITTSRDADADVTFCRLRHLVSETTAPLSHTCRRDQSMRLLLHHNLKAALKPSGP
jgi:hypothetical protein